MLPVRAGELPLEATATMRKAVFLDPLIVGGGQPERKSPTAVRGEKAVIPYRDRRLRSPRVPSCWRVDLLNAVLYDDRGVDPPHWDHVGPGGRMSEHACNGAPGASL